MEMRSVSRSPMQTHTHDTHTCTPLAALEESQPIAAGHSKVLQGRLADSQRLGQQARALSLVGCALLPPCRSLSPPCLLTSSRRRSLPGDRAVGAGLGEVLEVQCEPGEGEGQEGGAVEGGGREGDADATYGRTRAGVGEGVGQRQRRRRREL